MRYCRHSSTSLTRWGKTKNNLLGAVFLIFRRRDKDAILDLFVPKPLRKSSPKSTLREVLGGTDAASQLTPQGFREAAIFWTGNARAGRSFTSISS